jgi:hypothetical protein
MMLVGNVVPAVALYMDVSPLLRTGAARRRVHWENL